MSVSNVAIHGHPTQLIYIEGSYNNHTRVPFRPKENKFDNNYFDHAINITTKQVSLAGQIHPQQHSYCLSWPSFVTEATKCPLAVRPVWDGNFYIAQFTVRVQLLLPLHSRALISASSLFFIKCKISFRAQIIAVAHAAFTVCKARNVGNMAKHAPVSTKADYRLQ